VKASELVRGQRGRRLAGRDSGDVTARVGGQASYRQARAQAPERTLRVVWPATSRCQEPKVKVKVYKWRATGDEPAGMRLAKWPRFWKRHHGLA
jgi:hypothetical protein